MYRIIDTYNMKIIIIYINILIDNIYLEKITFHYKTYEQTHNIIKLMLVVVYYVIFYFNINYYNIIWIIYNIKSFNFFILYYVYSNLCKMW